MIKTVMAAPNIWGDVPGPSCFINGDYGTKCADVFAELFLVPFVAFVFFLTLLWWCKKHKLNPVYQFLVALALILALLLLLNYFEVHSVFYTKEYILVP